MQKNQEIDLPDLKPPKTTLELGVDDFLSNSEAVILDIRSEGEYQIGHIENAISFPLFSNEERALVGTCYKKKGKDIAVELGLEIVGPKLHQFVKTAKKLAGKRPLYLYCWRGGMRSRSMAWLLATAGFKVSLLKGGYKAYRQSFLTDTVVKPWNFITLQGSTGSGKTEFLDCLDSLGEQVLDLERLANHRGSVFGGFGLGKQPSTEEFINRINQKLRSFDSSKRVWVEGESMLIGRCFIPQELFDLLLKSSYYIVNMSKEERVERLVEEYGSFSIELVEEAFSKITKRMGGNNVKEAMEAFSAGDISKAVAMALDYYDKGYAQASEKRVGEDLGSITCKKDNHMDVAKELINSLNKDIQ